jgi:hypothetical protein
MTSLFMVMTRVLSTRPLGVKEVIRMVDGTVWDFDGTVWDK